MLLGSRMLLQANRPCQSLVRQRLTYLQTCQFKFMNVPLRQFADAVVQQPQSEDNSVEAQHARIGVDKAFSEQKHAYVLTFPWNFPEIVDKFERQGAASGYWPLFVQNSRAVVQFNDLFRVFHQSCALNDQEGIRASCEGKLAHAVNQSLDRIHFHGLDIEMANLTVEQPSIKVLKVEISHGVNMERARNMPKDAYSVTNSSMLGAKCDYYTAKSGQQSVLDFLGEDHRPYLLAVTTLVESPMKLFVQNQNYSKILFGSNDAETVKNVVRFEANLGWTDLLRILPVDNKRPQPWRITDFNNLMNENPLF